MELRNYQKRIVTDLSSFLAKLRIERATVEKLASIEPDVAKDIDFPRRAWESSGRTRVYKSSASGMETQIPTTCIKVPTGGGKTLLACHSIELVNRLYLQQQGGLVLWIVPTSKIYEDTLKNLRDRNHPYREVLDIASANQTLILEKTDNFSINDVRSNLCVLLLMLPSANRQTKDTLRMFKDSGSFTSFFPDEDDFSGNADLLDEIPNLDTWASSGSWFGDMPKTSLGNVLRILRPMIIVDEVHKAYSKGARETINGFNPSFVLELSATPGVQANVVASAGGRELLDEEMIKLDLHVVNKHTADWKDTLIAAARRRDDLEAEAARHGQNTNVQIRPIALITVERTGKDQRDGKMIHADDAKEFLVQQLGIPEDQVAIKSSSKDDIEGIDLLSEDCSIRYIITKQALQEGWDCPFAYVLCILGRSTAATSMTQLVGRVLRQPYAKKTGIPALDESYVYAYQRETSKLIGQIKKTLEDEGLGDLTGGVREVEDEPNSDTREIGYRDKFKKFEGKIFLPIFAIKEGSEWRELHYEIDLLSQVDWSQIKLQDFDHISLENRRVDDESVTVGFAGNLVARLGEMEEEFESEINFDQVARHLVDIIPNPWTAYEIGRKAISKLVDRYDKEIVASNSVFVVEELRKSVRRERDRLCEGIFRKQLGSGKVRFYIVTGDSHSRLPTSVEVRSSRRLTHEDGQQLQLSLLDYVPEEGMNELEKEVALFLDRQGPLLFWYRNISRKDYRIQGWQPGRVHPDFITANETDDAAYDTLYILETKGNHLSGNDDTEYKRALLELCSTEAVKADWKKLGLLDSNQQFVFELVDEDGWQSQLSSLIS